MRKRPAEERFWEKVTKGRGCWEWTAYKGPTGYGRLRVDGRLMLAHRFAYSLANPRKKIEGRVVYHTCDNPGCCRSSHLRLGSQNDNVQDCILKGRRRYAKGDSHWSRLYPERRPRGSSHWTRACSKRVKRAKKIKKLLGEGQSTLYIALVMKCSRQTVESIKHGKQWVEV